MSGFSDLIHAYWKTQMLEGGIIHFDELFTLVSNPKLRESYKMMILEMANTHTMAVVTPKLAECLKLKELEQYSIASLRTAISKCQLVLHSPDYIYYLPDNAVPFSREVRDDVVIRPLSMSQDAAAFREFESSCTEEDLDGAYVSLTHWVVYGAFDGDTLIGVSSMYLWDDTKLADLGVLILETYRDRGVATRLVQAICRDVISKGYVPQYRCQVDNEASIALAMASGFSLFGQWEAIVAEEE